MVFAELSVEENSKVKELCVLAHISHDEAVNCLKENNWDVSKVSRQFFMENITEDKSSSKELLLNGEDKNLTPRHMPGYAFYLPDLERLPNEFRIFLEKDLIETSTQRRLESSRHLNWWYQFGQRLYPLSTTGDGNCLLHAASLGVWGLHDRQLTLRETLYEMLMRGTRKTALWRRWKWAEHNAIHSSELTLTLSDEEWEHEWNSIISLATPVPRKQEDTGSDSTDQIYESLEAIHVFALAHVLKRPIVIVSDTVLRNAKGEELSPVLFGGIYLPLECAPDQCNRSPLVLCYDSAHFSPLVTMRNDTNMQQIVPIIDSNRNLLPVHYAVDPGPDFTWWKNDMDNAIASRLSMSEAEKLSLISEYMDIVRLDLRRGSVRSTRRVRGVHTPIVVDPTASADRDNAKGMTLASSGIAPGRQEKRRILNEITHHLLRTLKFSNAKHKDKSVNAEDCVSHMNKANCVLAAQLVPSSHAYMEVMVNEYMKSAQKRFQSTDSNVGLSSGRKRISRSFSASSLMITCINFSCTQPASQATNFLCDSCFAQQKLLMMSFNCERPNVLRSTPTSNSMTPKSTTMPAFTATQPDAEPNAETNPFVLDVTKSDGDSKTTQLCAVDDVNGIRHYYYPGQKEVRPPGTSEKSTSM